MPRFHQRTIISQQDTDREHIRTDSGQAGGTWQQREDEMNHISHLFSTGDKATAAALLDAYNDKYPDMRPVKPNVPVNPSKVYFHRIQDHDRVLALRAKKEELERAFEDESAKAEHAITSAANQADTGSVRDQPPMTARTPPLDLILDPVSAAHATAGGQAADRPAISREVAELARGFTSSSTDNTPQEREPTQAQLAQSRLSKEVITLRNGDKLQGGRVFPVVAAQIEAGFIPLQPHLDERMQAMSPPVPVSCFTRPWLLQDQAKWQRPRTEAEKKKAKLTPNSDLPSDFLMLHGKFPDIADLFIEYVGVVYGWTLFAEQFTGLRDITVKLKRKTGCWMLALRYFIKVIEGVMTLTPDGVVPNAGELQQNLLQEALDDVTQFGERVFKLENPYVPGGDRVAINPSNKEPKVDTTATPETPAAPVATPAPAQSTSQPEDRNQNNNQNNNRRNRGGNGGNGGHGGNGGNGGNRFRGNRGGDRGGRRGRSRDFNPDYNRYSRDRYSRSPDRRRFVDWHEDRGRDCRDSPDRSNRGGRRGGQE